MNLFDEDDKTNQNPLMTSLEYVFASMGPCWLLLAPFTTEQCYQIVSSQ